MSGGAGMTGAGTAGASTGGSLMNNPMMLAGLTTLAGTFSNDRRGQGGRAIMHGLSAYNQAQQFNAMQQLREQRQEMMAQKVAREEEARIGLPKQMQELLGDKYPEMGEAMAGMLKYRPELAAPMLNNLMQGDKTSVFREKINLAGIDPDTPEGQQAVRDIIEKSATTVNLNAGPKAEAGTIVVRDESTPSGYKAIPVTGSKLDVSRKEAVQGLKTGRANVVNMLGLIKKHGSEMGTILSGKEGQKVAGRMKQMYGETISLIAQLNNLGVLQPGEMKIMMEQLPDPTTAKSYGIGNDRMIAAYQQVLERLDRVVSSKSTMLGLEEEGVEIPEGFE